MSGKVITRFAPSPTGFLHIGGVRTALFNWLFAKANDGSFLLRIEDTDRERSDPKAINAILEGLSWMGLNWEGEPYYQSQHQARHLDVANQLIELGAAYKCTARPEEINIIRDKARALNQPAKYPGRDQPPPDTDQPYVIRFKAPQTGITVINDGVQGEVKIDNNQMDDLVLVRSDGTPTYMLAVVVDDHDMGITHIIRGDDHLTNAARQTLIYQALDWSLPSFSHVPLIHGPDGAKLSKRHGALGVEAYLSLGFMPQALRNYLVRLGWSHGDDEIISLEKMIEWFDISGIGKAPARFDTAKLEHLNGHYLNELEDRDVFHAIKQFTDVISVKQDLLKSLNGEQWSALERAIPSLKPRAKTFIDLIEQAEFLFLSKPLTYDDKSLRKFNTPELIDHLTHLLNQLKDLKNWEKTDLEGIIRGYCETNELKFGFLAGALRHILTSGKQSPGLFDTLFALGAKEALNRIEYALTIT